MMHLEKLGNYTFWPIFRRFLQWELDQKLHQRPALHPLDRGALYYELNEDYGSALELYTQSGNKAKVADLLVKNAGLHPGMGHYLEMEPYYRALPEAEVRKNPALMQAMSMLCAMEMDFAGRSGGMPRWTNTGPEPQGPIGPGSPQPSGLAGHWPAPAGGGGADGAFSKGIP